MSWCWLFPRRGRDFPGKVWLKIACRTLHLIGLAGLGGAYLHGVAQESWRPYLWLTFGSGVGMLALEVWSHGVWLLQIRGLAILLKCTLLLLTLSSGAAASLGFWLALGISGVFSHAPGRIRHYSPFFGRAISADDWGDPGRSGPARVQKE